MELSPRYDADPIIQLDGKPSDIAVPAIRQRRRLVETLASFGDAEWAHPSRCAGWSNRDVIVHLDSTNPFWVYTTAAGVGGTPTRVLANFDPVSSPAQMVAADDVSSGELLHRFRASTEALVNLWESMDDDGWSSIAEAPPGHLNASAVAHHALWDSWVHERDILLPMGATPAVEADEIAASLRYAAALAAALGMVQRGSGSGVLSIAASGPDVAAIVDIGDHVAVRSGVAVDPDLTLTGNAVHLLEALSVRARLEQTVPSESSWMINGLAEIFEAGR